jgi:hypothetical protein
VRVCAESQPVPTRKTPDFSPDLQRALNALDKELDQVYFVTRALCYWWHSGERRDDDQNYSGLFNEWSDRYPEIVNDRFRDLVTQHTPPAAFLAFFDVYRDMMAITVRRVFGELVEISPARKGERIPWAEAWIRNRIGRYRDMIPDWVCWACYGKPYDASLLPPLGLTMEPAGNKAYRPKRAWEPMDAASTEKLFASLADRLGRRLESQIEEDAGRAALEARKRREPSPSTKVIEAPGGREIAALGRKERERAARRETKDWQELHERIMKALPGDTLTVKETAFYLCISTRMVGYLVSAKKPKLIQTREGGITIESVKQYALGPK